MCCKKEIKLIGSLVKEFRVIRGLSQRDLSQLVGCSKNTIGQVERGETVMHIDLLIKLSYALKVPISKFVKPIETISKISLYQHSYDLLKLFRDIQKISNSEFIFISNLADNCARSKRRIRKKNSKTGRK